MEDIKSTSSLIERLYWCIRLRWIAVGGIISTVVFASNILRMPLEVGPLYGIALFLGVYNAAFLIILNSLKKKAPLDITSAANKIANTQISLDLFSLTVLLHFSGGIENPFIFYFIFHMIIASILLTRLASFLQATFAIILFLCMVFLEYKGLLRHYPLEGFVPSTLHNNILYISGVSFVFISTLYIAVYMATSISSRLRQREKSLKEANTLLNEKDRIKSEYVLRVTHDIKEHLSAIEGCIEPVADGITGALNERQKDLLFRARDRAGKLIFFVKALLEITRLKLTKRIKTERFSFSDLLKAIAEDIRLNAQERGLNFISDIDPSIKDIEGVRVYIEEAIHNLLANSLKYTPAGGEIIFKAESTGGRFLVQIKDTGIGIPEDELPHLFEEFFRGRNAKRIEREGTGLGLSITKEIMDMHKGRIWVESEEGKGAAFYLEFPKRLLYNESLL